MSLFQLTDEQEKAVNHLSGNLQIIACAGSGKTEVVSRTPFNQIKDHDKAVQQSGFCLRCRRVMSEFQSKDSERWLQQLE